MLNVKEIHQAMTAKGHAIFESDTKPYNLNIVGLRTQNRLHNLFDDWLYIMWKYQGAWSLHAAPCTTDPGTYWLKKDGSGRGIGTAIVKPGQYRGMWKLGKHQGRYPALVQGGDVTVLRDNDKDGLLDLDTASEETGLFGINQHRSSKEGTSTQVDKWSAGCIVNANSSNFDLQMYLYTLASQFWGDSFTFTLLDEREL